MVYRIYVQKKDGLDHGATALKKDLKDLLGIKGIEELRMYNRYDLAEDYCSNIKNLPIEKQKPFVLCEYVHAMGNGPGDLEDYFQLFLKYDCFCGGFCEEYHSHRSGQGFFYW